MDSEENEECPENGITSAGHTDGFGSCYGAMQSVYLYAYITDRPFCPRPWDHVGHYTDSVKGSKMFYSVGGHLLGPRANANTTVFRDQHRYILADQPNRVFAK